MLKADTSLKCVTKVMHNQIYQCFNGNQESFSNFIDKKQQEYEMLQHNNKNKNEMFHN